MCRVSRQKGRFDLKPFAADASTQLAIGRPALREAVVDDVVAVDTERVLG
jgi:hypothetical protein